MGRPKRNRSPRHTPSRDDQSGPHRLRSLAEQLLAQGKILPALEALNSLIELGKAGVSDWLLTGKTLLSVREYAQAMTAFEQGLRLDSQHEECRYGLATALFQLGDVTSAVNQFQWVAERSGNLNAWMSLATIIPGCPASDLQRVSDVRQRFVRSLNAAFPPGPPYRHPAATARRPLRIGYSSAFFHRPNYMNPVWGLINGHDRERFDISLFADDTDENGLAWFQTRPHDQFHLTRGLSNAELTALIRAQELDVFVDLNGYSVPSRLQILLSPLARVAVAWFNMYATSALPGIQWIIGDELVVRQDEECFYCENVARLPQSYLSFVVRHDTPDVTPPPCLHSGHFTFGSLVSQYKVTPSVVDAWSSILLRVPTSRLVLANRTLGATCNRDYIVEQFRRRGVTPEQLRFLPPAGNFEFLKYYNQIDLALDSFPYNGGTTTTEAIWQGVPVLTFDGDRWASRTSKTLLKNCHLGEFVAADAANYIDTAVNWATTPNCRQRLAELRTDMRETLRNSPVCQIDRMVHAMEQLYVQMIDDVNGAG